MAASITFCCRPPDKASLQLTDAIKLVPVLPKLETA